MMILDILAWAIIVFICLVMLFGLILIAVDMGWKRFLTLFIMVSIFVLLGVGLAWATDRLILP